MSWADYTVKIDWNNDGDFGDANEDITTDVMKITYWRGRTDDLGKAEPGGARITVKDPTGKYVPENTLSALYGDLVPNRPVRIQATFDGGGPYDLFYGYIDDIIPDPTPNAQRAMIACVDGFDRLKRAKISMAVDSTGLYSGLAGGAATGIVYTALSLAGWPVAKRTIDSGVDTYPVVFGEKERALTFLQQVEQSEWSFMYINGAGNLCWEDRHYRISNARCTGSNWTSTAALYRKITPLEPCKTICNLMSITAHPKTKQALGVIWTLQDNVADSPYLSALASKTFVAHFADANGRPNIADDVVTPSVVGGDVEASSTTAGGGDLDANVSVTALVDNTNLFADRADVKVTNDSATTPFYLTFLRVRGAIFEDEGELEIKSEDATSQNDYGIRDIDANLPFYQHAEVMQGVGDYIISQKKDPSSRYEIALSNKTNAILTEILEREISDRITMQNADLNIDADYFIEHMRHEINPRAKTHECWWVVSEADDQMYWIMDTSQLGPGYEFPTRLAY